MSAARRRPRRGRSTTATLRCGSQRRGLALPVELQRRRADDDRRERVVGLERRERLDGLAEALLVGEEARARVERRSARPPTGTARARRRAPPRPRGSARPPSRASGGSARSPRRARRAARRAPARPSPSTSTGVQARGTRRAGSTTHGSIGSVRACVLGAGQPAERGAGVVVPQDVEAQALALEALGRGQPRRRRLARRARRRRRSDARRRVEPRGALLVERPRRPRA